MENAKIEVGCNRWNCSDFAAHLLSLNAEEGENANAILVLWSN